ncbi:hypothetical protein [Roseiflexus sp.]|uniref:hypothetical protein n=1 Tax=Roseiflexus sp. TaxID=2562120 RepID=UPI00398B2DB5
MRVAYTSDYSIRRAPAQRWSNHESDTTDRPAADAGGDSIRLEMVKLSGVRRGQMVDRRFA